MVRAGLHLGWGQSQGQGHQHHILMPFLNIWHKIILQMIESPEKLLMQVMQNKDVDIPCPVPQVPAPSPRALGSMFGVVENHGWWAQGGLLVSRAEAPALCSAGQCLGKSLLWLF